jgi:hypothetical protein
MSFDCGKRRPAGFRGRDGAPPAINISLVGPYVIIETPAAPRKDSRRLVLERRLMQRFSFAQINASADELVVNLDVIGCRAASMRARSSSHFWRQSDSPPSTIRCHLSPSFPSPPKTPSDGEAGAA